MIHRCRNMFMLLALAAVMLFPAGASGATKKVVMRKDVYEWVWSTEDWGLVQTDKYSYTAKGNEIRHKTRRQDAETGEVHYDEEVVTSYKSGKISQEATYYDGKLINTKTYTYYKKGKNTKGKLYKVTVKDGKKTLYTMTYKYNSKGYLTSIVTKAGKNTEKTKVKQTYKKGILRKEVHTDEDSVSETWTYDSKGRLATYALRQEGYSMSITYYTNGNPRVRVSAAYEGGHEIVTERYYKDGTLKSYKSEDTEEEDYSEEGPNYDYYLFSREEEGNKVTVTAPEYQMHVVTFKEIKS